MRTVMVGLLALTLASLGVPAAAQDEFADPRAGRELAERWCAECHYVGPGERGESLMGAPSFQDRADDPAVTRLYLRVFLRTPHATMPNYRLTPEQTDDIVAHILNLKSR